MVTKIIRMSDVTSESGLSRSTIYLRIAQGLWPKQISLGARAVGWNSSEVEAIPATLSLTGKSRFSQFRKFIPISREKFRRLFKIGRTPQPERLGDVNAEFHYCLFDSVNFRTGK